VGDGWSGIVLTGGRSRRMGRDKALLAIDGEAMAVRVARALTDAGATEVVCVGGDTDALRALGLVAIADDHPDAGPLGGILTGLARAASEIIVVTPCDLVSPSERPFRDLVAKVVAGRVTAAVPIVDGQWRPLPMALRTSARDVLAEAFARGERAVHRAMERLDFVTVDVGALRDADTPEDLPDHR
jgi:molybdopterin-guanine dinucleotide biosynthesis protein A